MHGWKTGKGQVYLGDYKGKDGVWLDGGESYKLHVPAKAPIETFWPVAAFETSARALINNKYEVADSSSRMDLGANSDGSVDVCFGPGKPKGDKANNCIPTEEGRAWFAYFCFFSPEKTFMDRSWVVPDIEKAILPEN